MQIPSRVLYGGRSGAPAALIAATAAVTLMFSATPYLLEPMAERYGVSEGMAGAISIAQVGAFAAINLVFPRLLRPSGRLLRTAAIVLVVFNLLSALPSYFPALVALRVVAGAAAGTMTWLAWSSAMSRSTSMAPVAMTGPLTALVFTPLIAVLSTYGDRAVYVALAVATIPAALTLAPIPGRKRARGVVSASKSNRVLLIALGGLTFFGSSLYINEAIVAREIHDLSAFASSLAFSLNALGALVGARLSTRHRHPGWFVASIGPAALITVLGPLPLYYLGMGWWGFAFWMGIPGILQMLTDRSLQPAERAGDGQGVMALGRAAGPAFGAAFVDAGALAGLAITASIGIAASGSVVIGVKEGRERLPPTDPNTLDQRTGE